MITFALQQFKIIMDHSDYAKLKAKASKKQIAQNAIDLEKQLLEELKENHPHVLDVYFSPHHGDWSLRSTNNDHDMQDFESFLDLLGYLKTT